MKTKKEVIDFLESKVGTKVPCKGNSSLDGQCVTLIKALMEFIGVPDPYKARGHAKTVISAYLNEGIADAGLGFLSVFSNKNMGGGYGHIWCNAGEGAGTYYESNGAKPLTVTKGEVYTYDAVCNFDKYIKEGVNMIEVPNEKFEELVKKSTEYDKFKARGWMTADEVDKIIKDLEDTIARYEIDKKSWEGDIRELNDEIEKLKNSPVITPDDPSIKWVLNGKTEESTVNGVKITKNYAIKELI